MKIKKDFMLRTVGGQQMVVPLGETSKKLHGVIHLNEVGAFLWKLLERDCTEEGLISAVVSEYDVSAEVARTDIEAFLNSLREASILE